MTPTMSDDLLTHEYPSEYRRAVRALLESVRAAASEIQTQDLTPMEIGVVTRLREAFVTAGLERIRRIVRPSAWLQWGVAFTGPEQARAFLGSAGLREAVHRWMDEGLVQRFWFMNKAPGVRVRFLVADPTSGADATITAWLEEARTRNFLDRVEPGLYDPETHQFGGDRGLEIFHDFSTHDSLGVLRYRELRASGQTTVDETVMSLLALTDLLDQATDDSWEHWDVWCEMRLTGRVVPLDAEGAATLEEALSENGPTLASILHDRSSILAELHPEEAVMLQRYTESNRSVARNLARAARERALSCGPRKILPFYVIFHWNRIGLSIDDQVGIAMMMRAFLDPKTARA